MELDAGRAVRRQARRRATGGRHLVTGEEVGDIFRDGKAYDVNVWSTPETRNSLTAIAPAADRHARRRVVRLKRSPTSTIKPPPSSIHREDVSRTIEVGANVRGRDLGSVAEDIEDGLEEMKLPLGYHAEVSGEYTERQEADRRLLLYGGLAAIGIFFLLVTSFRSGRLAALSFFTPAHGAGRRRAGRLPVRRRHHLARLAGRVLHRSSASWPATASCRSATSSTSRSEEGETFGPDLVLRGAQERLAPILMTALTTGLALVPLLARREHPRSGDRVPDGDRHRRRPGHFDDAQPVRRARRCTCASAVDGASGVRPPPRHEIAQGDGRGRVTTKAAPLD